MTADPVRTPERRVLGEVVVEPGPGQLRRAWSSVATAPFPEYEELRA